MAGDIQAIDNAARLTEIKFPEFTAKLITGTFEAITNSYIEQMGQYLNVLKAASQTLQDYINNTKDDISADEINAFLLSLGGLDDATLNFLLGDSTNATVSSAALGVITPAVALPATAGDPTTLTVTNLSTKDKKDAILAAVARRIAVNKYDLLQTMVRQGLLRLYVDNGTIETRLTFTTYGQVASSSSTTNRNRAESSFAAGAGGGVGGLIPNGLLGVAGGLATSKSTLSVSTAQSSQRDVSGSRVQVFGRVKLNFKTDFLPLNAPQP